MYYELTDRIVVAADPAATWAYFSDARNLPDITPPKMKFRIRRDADTPLRQGAVLDYTVNVAGLPLGWRTLILDWEAPHRFVDLQLRGPYLLWHHEHTFTPADAGGTLCADRVLYRLPLGPVGRVLHAISVRRQLLAIFAFRRQVVAARLGLRESPQEVTIRALG